MKPREIINLIAENIYIGDRLRKTVDAERVAILAQSIDKIGLMTPITIRTIAEMEIDGVKETDVPVLVAGLHRLEAFKKLGIESIPCIEMESGDIEAQMWEIAENLHRAELTALERDQHIARWVELNAAKVSQSGTPGGKQPKAKGIRAAQRELGIQKNDASRAIKVASLSEDAKAEAIRSGLDDNRTALLRAAKESEPEKQVAALRQHKPVKLADDPLNDMEALEKQVAALMAAWNKASQQAREEFLLRIDQPVMDRRFA